MPRGPSTRIERRRAEERARIIHVASERFAKEGPDGIALEDVGKAADVSRGSFYKHFPTKESLLYAIVAPLLDEGARAIEVTPKPHDARSALERLCDVYFSLHNTHPHAMRVSYRVQGMPLKALGPAHGAFLKGVLGLLRVMAQEERLLPKDPILAARLVATVGVPVLELYKDHEDRQMRFAQTMSALLLDAAPKKKRVSRTNAR